MSKDGLRPIFHRSPAVPSPVTRIPPPRTASSGRDLASPAAADRPGTLPGGIRAPVTAQAGRAARRKRAPDFAMALDATGSMEPLIEKARRSTGRIIDGMAAKTGIQVRIRLYVFRDYDVPHGLCECSDLTGDTQHLSRWLASIQAYGGGPVPGEAIEAALAEIYRTGEAAAVLLAGDEPSNTRTQIDRNGLADQLTAHQWASLFGEDGVPIHTFRLGKRRDTRKDFAEIARLSGGQSGQLDGSDAMTCMAMMAMLDAVEGDEAVARYAEANPLPAAALEFSRKLIAGPKEQSRLLIRHERSAKP